jgi:oxalate decarboxylase
MSSHHFRFSHQKPQDKSEGGYRIKATKSNFPALQKMSLYKLTLHQHSAREPHWHANADELGYCLQGKVVVSFYGNQNTKESFVVNKGGAFLIPSGALHAIENVGKETAELILQFSHEEPEDFGLSRAFGTFSDAVLGNTWDVSSKHFQSVKRRKKESFIVKLAKSTPIPQEFLYTSSYQFALEESAPLISNAGGSAKVARHNVWPVLRKQALYSLILTGRGMREPHWHPETAEMGYVASGKGRMSILSPSGKVDTYEMEKGDIYFIPQAYPHHIENLASSDLHLLIFFDHPMPQDIGFSGSVKSFSDEVLSKTMHCPEEVFKKLPTYYEDRFIVSKKR